MSDNSLATLIRASDSLARRRRKNTVCATGFAPLFYGASLSLRRWALYFGLEERSARRWAEKRAIPDLFRRKDRWRVRWTKKSEEFGLSKAEKRRGRKFLNESRITVESLEENTVLGLKKTNVRKGKPSMRDRRIQRSLARFESSAPQAVANTLRAIGVIKLLRENTLPSCPTFKKQLEGWVNMIASRAYLSWAKVFDLADLPDDIRGLREDPALGELLAAWAEAKFERSGINGVAKRLGISRATFYRRYNPTRFPQFKRSNLDESIHVLISGSECSQSAGKDDTYESVYENIYQRMDGG
jgi:hypothetical protein